LDELARRFSLADALGSGPVADPGAAADIDPEAVARFRERMDDDLDTPGALATVFELVRRANSAADAGDLTEGHRRAETVALLCAALGLALRPGPEVVVDEASTELAHRRDQARAERDWALADALRSELESAGWVVEDSAEGTRIRRQ
jgi:cysteinyl-tRNA synthetase